MKLFIRVCWWLPDPDASELFSSSSKKTTSPLTSGIFYRPPSTVVKEDRGKATVMWVFLLAAFVAYVVFISVNAVEMRKNPPVQILRKVRACWLTERQTGYEGREEEIRDTFLPLKRLACARPCRGMVKSVPRALRACLRSFFCCSATRSTSPLSSYHRLGEDI